MDLVLVPESSVLKLRSLVDSLFLLTVASGFYNFWSEPIDWIPFKFNKQTKKNNLSIIVVSLIRLSGQIIGDKNGKFKIN